MPWNWKRAALKAGLGLPPRVRHGLVGAPPVNDRGHALDRDLWWMLALEKRLPVSLGGGDVASARKGMLAGVRVVEGEPRPQVRVSDGELAGHAVRRYLPPSSRCRMLYLHGGGHVVGDLDSHDRLCQRLAEDGCCEVVALHYPLAPEQPFPAAPDAIARVLGELEGGAECWWVGGDSAGGNLALVAALDRLRAGATQPAGLLLIYPVTDMTGAHASRESFRTGFLLESAQIDWYRDHYGVPDREDPRASPLFEPELSSLPPTVLVTAGFDPLRDEGEAMVARMRDAGVSVDWVDAVDMVHGFANMDGAIAGADSWMTRTIDAFVGLAHGEMR